ncbi:MAG: NADH-quinone oxidoreductase subunit NuoN [Arcobacter sp.]|nr:NADH-quinone oxidoreductase subunit NuoN [Arcobacter sp.]
MITPISINMMSLNLPSIIPMSIAILGALFILCIDLFRKHNDKHFYVVLTALFLLIDLVSIVSYSGTNRGFFDVLLVDGISLLAQAIIVISSALFIFLSLTKQRFHEYRYPEYFALFLFMTAGFQFMASSDNLILIFVGLETASLSLYTMIAMHNRDKATEAAIKYFTMGALAAGFYAFGSMILYYVTGSVELSQIANHFAITNFDNYPLILLGVVFMIGALGFKLSLVPFHTWAPDVYEGSSASMAGYIAIVPKVAILVVALRFFGMFIQADDIWVKGVLYMMAIITMTLPNLIALVQTDVKRMLAFSSISHAGFVLVAIMLGTTQAIESLFLYWILFAFVIVGAFAMLWVHRTKEAPEFYGFKSDYQFDKFTGLVKTAPVAAFMLGILMLALAGVPPFSLFWGKMYLLSATIHSGEILLAVIMVLNSAIAAFYYLKLIVFMFLKTREDKVALEYQAMNNLILKVIIGIAVTFAITAVFWLDTIISVVRVAVQSSGY